MNRKAVLLARQILRDVPKSDVSELIEILKYYNGTFSESDRVRAMELGSNTTVHSDVQLEARVRIELLEVSRGSLTANSYISADKNVCRLCGK